MPDLTLLRLPDLPVGFVRRQRPALNACLVLLILALLGEVTPALAVRHLTFSPNQYAATVTNNGFIPEADISYEMWFRTRASGGLFGIVASDPDVRDWDRCLTIDQGRLYHYVWRNREGTEVIQSQGNNFNDGNWHHVAIVLDSQRGHYMFVDGQQQAQGNFRGSLFDWADRWVIGYSMRPGVGQQWFNGDIDEFRFWNIALSPNQIRERMAIPLEGDEQGLIAYYRMNEGQGQAVADDSPNDNPLRLGNAAGQDNFDPRWSEGGAPISGAIGEISARMLNFPPLGRGRAATMILTLTNRAEQQGDLYRLNYRFTDQGGDPRWLTIDPAEGSIEAGEDVDITFTANAEGIEAGDYRRTVRLVTDGRGLLALDIPASITITAGSGTILGRVLDAANGRPVADARVQAEGDFEMAAVTDGDGRFAFADIAAYAYRFVVTKVDYLPLQTAPVEVDPGDEVSVEWNLLHSRLVPDPDAVVRSIAPDDRLEVALTLDNPGNGPLTWSVVRQFPGADADPWDLRRSLNVGAALNDDRIEGALFIDDHFYLA
ncbi:MAG: hypothetical protein FJY67_02905, partial [Calditrichaeota bacterium]|nr:hypothetical protein [Calditrichota bacterium]